MVPPTRFVRVGQRITLTMRVTGGQSDVLRAGVSSLNCPWLANLAPGNEQPVLGAGRTGVWTCNMTVEDPDGDGNVPLYAVFQGSDRGNGQQYKVTASTTLTVAHPGIALQGKVTHSEYVDNGISRVDVDWTVANTGNIPVTTTIGSESKWIDVGRSETVAMSYDAPAGQVFSQPLEISGTDDIGQEVRAAAVAQGAAAAPGETQAPAPETTTTRPSQPIPPNDTPDTVPESDPDLQGIVGEGNGSNGGANTGGGGSGGPTTSATQPASNTTQTTAAPTSDGTTTSTPGSVTIVEPEGDAAGSSPTTTAPADDTVGTDPGAGVTPSTEGSTDATVAEDGDDETAVRVVPPTGSGSLSWSTRVATIAGGALFGLALAGFGWVYVSATQGIERRIRRTRKR
jgi:hypothetical protein